MKSKFLLAAVFLIAVSCRSISYPASNELISGSVLTVDDSAAAEETANRKDVPWRGTFYLAFGAGSPYELRLEAGFNISKILSIAFSTGDFNTRQRGSQSTIGLLLKINIPMTYEYSPYLLLGTGGEIPFSEAKYSYKIINGGLRITLTDFLQFNAELGLAFISEFFSGEGYYPDMTLNKTKLGFHVSLELDVAQLF